MHDLYAKLGIAFHDERLLQSVFVHRSLLNEHPDRVAGLGSNERLEFLGDAILNFLTADWLYQRFPDHREGQLTELRKALVNTHTLAGFSRELKLGDYVRLVRGQDNRESRNRPALLADLFEALLGAIYLDQGIDVARHFVRPYLEREIDSILAGRKDHDYRTRLQQQMQAEHGITPVYRTLSVEGPAHRSEFTVAVLLGDQQLGIGRGLSKQAAAQEAARVALEATDNNSEPVSP
jgi:ribonuclease-3